MTRAVFRWVDTRETLADAKQSRFKQAAVTNVLNWVDTAETVAELKHPSPTVQTATLRHPKTATERRMHCAYSTIDEELARFEEAMLAFEGRRVSSAL